MLSLERTLEIVIHALGWSGGGQIENQFSYYSTKPTSHRRQTKHLHRFNSMKAMETIGSRSLGPVNIS